ncbi:MAG TPA: DNA ligase D [Novosphingobium sp.]|nr:DNA ligase D [Novosphingobium sp.]HPZ46799.1 DNA ligase D [Novosphingobium sp.]HQD99925.1 DNA ligase D [Novosphingobium sp.]
MARSPAALKDYHARRDFARTPEPSGKAARNTGSKGGSRAGAARFIVQKHDATRLHWDFRLELDGVLKSWAVTRGPSPDPDDKRLAVRTEDHPLDYADFEGIIPEGEYGGGTVMLWDQGTWEPVAGKHASDLEKGHLHFVLHGQRMKGEWLLIRLKPRGREKRENWLLRKLDDAHAGAPDSLVERGLTSVTTGRTMQEIAAGAKPRAGRRASRKRSAPPAFQPVQLATLVDSVPTGTGWLHETKYDGYRALLAIGGGEARVFTRSGLDWSDRFPAIAAAGAALDVDEALIDGEIVALGADGIPDFAALQDSIGGDQSALRYFAFDLLRQGGEDLRALPQIERKERLQLLAQGGPPPLHYAEHVLGSGAELLRALCGAQLEGVVSKRADAPYRAGRSRAWLKCKCIARQEFVVLGWTSSAVSGRGFAALLLGLRQEGELRYAGKVGTGFDGAAMDRLMARMEPLAADAPAAEVPRSAHRGAHWIAPELVAEVAFAEFTPSGVVRHASFIGLRDDKGADKVRLEQAVPLAEEKPVQITHPERVVFPDDGITKGELADYYRQMAPLMLATLAGRPLSLVRCPDGIGGKCFFQKHHSRSLGRGIGTVAIEEKDGTTEDYLCVDDAAGLLECVQMGTIEFHGWGSRAQHLEAPDRVVFDLDPDEAITFDEVRKAAHALKRHLADIGLTSFAMLSGGKGIHVIVPLVPDARWPAVADFAERFARALAEAESERFVATMSKAKRKGRIFIDWLRNQRGSTAVAPYSVRARAGAPVAAPVAWAELDEIAGPAAFTLRDAGLLTGRAQSAVLKGWGQARQSLPDI